MKTQFPKIKTERFLLRQFTEADLENVYRGLSNAEVIKYYGVSYNTLEETREQIKWFSNLEKTGDGIWWAICAADNEEFYGACGFNSLSTVHKKAELGFWLLPQFWGRGIIREAVPKILDYAFHNLNLHRIEAFVESENFNSKKALEKLNFTHEGCMRECEIKNGDFISLDIYAKLQK